MVALLQCSYPECSATVLEGSAAMSYWRLLYDGTGNERRRVLLCPLHAHAWDEHQAGGLHVGPPRRIEDAPEAIPEGDTIWRTR